MSAVPGTLEGGYSWTRGTPECGAKLCFAGCQSQAGVTGTGEHQNWCAQELSGLREVGRGIGVKGPRMENS